MFLQSEYIITYLGEGIGKIELGNGHCTFPLRHYNGNTCIWAPTRQIKLILIPELR